MPDSNLNISVTVDEGIENLKQLETAIKAQRAAWKGAAIGSQEYTEAGQKLASMLDERNELMKVGTSVIAQERDAYFQNGNALRSMQTQELGLTDTIKQARQERRLYMFAVREGMTAITAITGSEGELTKAVTSGTSAVFGMQFALTAMGGVFAEFALPVAIAIGLWTALKSLWGDSAKELSGLRDEQLKEIDILIQLGQATKAQKLEMLSAQIAEEQTVLSKMQSFGIWNQMLTAITGGKYTGQASAEDLTKQREKVEALTLSYKKLVDEIVKGSESTEKTKKSNPEKELADLQKQQDAMYQLGMLSDYEYLSLLKKREKQAELVKDYVTEAALRKEILDTEKKIASLKMGAGLNLGGALAGGKFNLTSNEPGYINPNQFGTVKSTAQENAESDQREAERKKQLTQEYLIDPLKSGFQSLAYSGLQGFNRMWEQSSGFARTVLGQAFESIADTLMEKGIPTLLSMIPGLGFLAHAEGGWLTEPVVGVGMSTGRIHTFAEKQPEYISTINHINQASQASRGGGGQTSIQVIPIVNASGISVMVKYGNQSRSGRTWG